MKIHHIGYAVKNINNSIYYFTLLGFRIEKDIIVGTKWEEYYEKKQY